MDCILFYLPKYRQEWVPKKLIEDAEGTYETNFYETSSFTLRMSADDELISILKEQCLVVPLSPRSDTSVLDNPFIVEKVYMGEDEEKGKNVTLSGRTADAMFSYRTLNYLWEEDGDIQFEPLDISNEQASDIVMIAFNHLFQVYNQDPYIPRKIPWVHISSAVPARSFPKISKTYTGENFLDEVNDLRKKYKFGIKAEMVRAKINDPDAENPDEWTLDFTVFKPNNYSSGNNRIILSAANDDIDSTDYNYDKTNEKTAIIALGIERHGEVIDGDMIDIETEFAVQSTTGEVGFFRKEDFEDLKGVKTAGLPGEVKETITEQASTFLEKPHEKISFVESANSRYKCKIDYDLGDILIVRDEFGNYGKVRCTKISEVFDYNGYRCIPTFDEWETIPCILRTKTGARFLTLDNKQIILNGGK